MQEDSQMSHRLSRTHIGDTLQRLRAGRMTGRSGRRRRTLFSVIAAAVLVTACLALGAGPVLAQTPAAWTVTTSALPTNFTPGATTTGTGSPNGGLNAFPQYFIYATNAGGTATSGPVTITDTLPVGIIASSSASPYVYNDSTYSKGPCEVSGQTVTCTLTDAVQPGQQLEAWIPVEVEASASGTLTDQVSVGGGEAAAASTTAATPISASPAAFGFAPGSAAMSMQAVGQDGGATSQAGSHPYSLTLNFGLASVRGAPEPESGLTYSGIVGAGHLKDLAVDLPRGLVVDPDATPVRCTEAELEEDVNGGGCPAASQVGVVTVTTQILYGGNATESPLFSMVPPRGVPAEFGFDAIGIGIYVHLTGGVNTGGDYSLTSTTNDILARPFNPILGVQAELWGDPSDSSHDYVRGECLNFGGSCPVQATTTPFLTMPSACSGPLTISASADSWEGPGSFSTDSGQSTDTSENPVGVTGCGQLDFSPTIGVTPDASAADSPSGLSVDLKVPQNESLGTLAEANLKDATVMLPAGMTVNPSAANGMAACSEAQIEMNGPEPATCPDASKIGSVEVDTPLLTDVMKGGIYLAQQGNLPGNGSNPFGSLLAIYVTAEADGALIKLAGKVEADPVTGQLTATFDENPQLPFEDFKLNFFGGERAPLATPATCGQYASTASFSSWAQPESPVSPVVQPFTLSSGAGGAACSAPGFSPSFAAGSSNSQAGAYSPFVMTVNRKDGEQRLGSVAFTMPRGLVGMISHVTPCLEAQADAGTCPAASQIGHVSVAAGVGGQPEVLPEPGRPEDPVYLTQSYRGAPFGIAVVVHVEAGPFNLGTVVVRGTINVDPHTAQVSIATDASGPYAMPSILQGIPVDLKSLNVEVNRPEFMLNPTSCEPMSATGTIGSAEGASVAVSSRFQAAGCQSLGFDPSFKAETHAGHTRKDGDALTVGITSKTGEANIAKVHVSLPRELPARLDTLKLACTEAQFAANPSGCPEGSFVGTATADTPVLSSPLTGPAIFVSHGNAEFPNLDLVLQGEGVTIVLEGNTFISGKTGVTTSTFASVPDAPISSFQLSLPTGPHSALAGEGNLCAKKQLMATQITGQNGAVVERETEVAVHGCSKKLKLTGHSVKGRDVKLKVYVPAAGKLEASAKGLSSKTKRASERGAVTIELAQKKRGRLHTKVSLVFKPSKGKKQDVKQTLKFKK
jgi:hypothetical protein